jgi:hypothetical protein
MGRQVPCRSSSGHPLAEPAGTLVADLPAPGTGPGRTSPIPTRSPAPPGLPPPNSTSAPGPGSGDDLSPSTAPTAAALCTSFKKRGTSDQAAGPTAPTRRPEPRQRPLTWLKRRGTYTPVCRGRIPITQRRFERAKAITRVTCHGDRRCTKNRSAIQAPVAFGMHAMPGILVFQVRKEYNSLCLRTQETVPLAEKGSTTHADYTCRLWDRVSALVSEVGRVLTDACR